MPILIFSCVPLPAAFALGGASAETARVTRALRSIEAPASLGAAAERFSTVTADFRNWLLLMQGTWLRVARAADAGAQPFR